MEVPKISTQNQLNPSFGYKTVIRKLWMKGKLPTVEYGLYQQKLTKKNCSNEHLIPHAFGGGTNNGNIALADKYINSVRGTKDIREFVTVEGIKKYLNQFIGVTVIHGKKIIFSGDKYIRDIIKTFKKLGVRLNPQDFLNN